MSNEQLIVYLMAILDNLNIAISKTMDNLPSELAVEKRNVILEPFLGEPPIITTFPVLDPILEFKESLYIQLEALRGNTKQ